MTKTYTPAALAGLSLACSLSLSYNLCLGGCARTRYSHVHMHRTDASRACVVRGAADRKGYGGGANHEKVDRQTH
jgi:hypothetical protein